MNNKLMKFENPVRLEELQPVKTLEKIGLRDNDVLCDIGAGTGIFAIPAAKMTKNKVCALEINEDMLDIMTEKARAENIGNLHLLKTEDEHLILEDNTADIVLLVTVLHEIQNKAIFINEIKRILKRQGKLAVIEFHKRQTPMGPPEAHRLGQHEVSAMFSAQGFKTAQDFVLGHNFYCLVLELQ